MDISNTKKQNAFFKIAIKSEVAEIKDELCLTEIQERIFDMRYFQRKPIDYIADILGFSRQKVDGELMIIRKMLVKIIK